LLLQLPLTDYLSRSLNTNGQDHLGNSILYQQLFLVKHLKKWRTKIEQDPQATAEHLHAVDISMSRLEWTLYNLNLFIGLALEQVHLSNKPTLPRPVGPLNSADTCNEHVVWQPYPVSRTRVDWHPHCHYLAYILLAEVITADEALYEEKRQSNAQHMAYKFEALYVRVKAWPDTIKPCMKMHDRAMPHVIALQ
jgi:hypothetical protein